MTSRIARAHPQPYRGRPKSRVQGPVRPRRGYKVVAAARFIGTVSRVETRMGVSAYLVVYLKECGEWVMTLPIGPARRIADMLRPFEEPAPEGFHILYADGNRIIKHLPGKRVWVHWSVQDNGEQRIYAGDVIELVEEDSDA